jgi:hypothetical protein
MIFVMVFSPGLLSPDSKTIYSQALQHQYNDHHPPLMGYIWHYLNYVVKGPLLMHLINIALIWSCIYLLAFKIFIKNKYFHIYCLCIPLIPHVACYAGFIWKDLIFTYGYGLISAYFSLKTIKSERISPTISVFGFILLFYFTSVKYQAQFILPLLIFWYFSIQSHFKLLKSLLITIPISVLFIFSIYKVNEHLINVHGQGSSNSWKYVKIYDLSGMSLHENKILVPKEFHRKKLILKNIQEKYSLEWESLIVEKDSPFKSPNTKEELFLIQKAWKDAVFKYPLSYIKHRGHIWYNGIVLGVPGKLWLDENLGKDNFISKHIVPLGILTAFIFLMPFQILFFFIGYRGARQTKTQGYGRSLLFMSTMGVTLLMVLFIFSLAAVPRYIYFTNYMFMISLPFAAQIVFQKKNEKA